MKTAVATMFDVPEELFHDQSKKEVKCIHNNQFSPRELLIWYGEMMMAKCGGPSFFVDIARKKIERALGENKIVIVTDLRTPIETYAMMELGARVFYINRENHLGPLAADAHFTESGVYVSKGVLEASSYQHYTEIDNNGLLSDTTLQILHDIQQILI